MKYVMYAVVIYCIYKIVTILIRDIKKRFSFLSCNGKAFEERMRILLEDAAFEAADLPRTFDVDASSEEEFMRIMRTVVLSELVEELYQDGLISLAGKYIWEEDRNDKRTIHRDDDSF